MSTYIARNIGDMKVLRTTRKNVTGAVTASGATPAIANRFGTDVNIPTRINAGISAKVAIKPSLVRARIPENSGLGLFSIDASYTLSWYPNIVKNGIINGERTTNKPPINIGLYFDSSPSKG